ncbi:MAG: hypothetical protein HN348_29415 [Proteobacteria bacterium]|nr:hypothetical protein [Pseudomonadota bacterium]
MPRTGHWLSWIYVINTTLLVCHEIDSAYWKEWELFYLPGGVQFFVFLPLPILVLFLWGLLLLDRGERRGLAFSLILGLVATGAPVIHGGFLALGNTQFLLPLSLALLGVMGVTGIVQLVMTIRLLAKAF